MKRTITELEKELSQIRKERAKGKYDDGIFGFKACKDSIRWDEKFLHKSLEEQYADYIKRGLYEVGFNIFMIVACEECMEEW